MSKNSERLAGKCHCGSVQFAVRLVNGLDAPIRCNCSLCRMRGAVVAFADLDGFELTSGGDQLKTYQFHTNVAKHYFCGTCGVYTHHQRRFNPNQYAVNVACLEGVSPFDFTDVPVVDGQNHPGDHGGGPLRELGRLRFDPKN